MMRVPWFSKAVSLYIFLFASLGKSVQKPPAHLLNSQGAIHLLK